MILIEQLADNSAWIEMNFERVAIAIDRLFGVWVVIKSSY